MRYSNVDTHLIVFLTSQFLNSGTLITERLGLGRSRRSRAATGMAGLHLIRLPKRSIVKLWRDRRSARLAQLRTVSADFCTHRHIADWKRDRPSQSATTHGSRPHPDRGHTR